PHRTSIQNHRYSRRIHRHRQPGRHLPPFRDQHGRTFESSPVAGEPIMSAHILAIDQSTSATKALIFDTTSNLIAKTSLQHKHIRSRAGSNTTSRRSGRTHWG